ncbi:unnamed protein product [Angiostrongylus costaricensis]|uniref:Xpo1 domain-containing protein n=1 Tax=Angiostrongylus costaricensis TaxID=334426 RepID=A0A158PJ64_ANGCS|nr:unnamed protein product [Angiostrongylus costaricensis]
MSKKVDVAAVAAKVQEFYATSNPDRRKLLDEDLCMFKRRFPCEDTVAACILLMGSRYPANVQYFAAVSMYETIRHRYEECVANMEVLKSFLIESLTSNAHVQMQSITNKLSSTLAILSLYCMPDVWSDPVATLTNIWAAQPELLLRVLAEIAAEFSNIQMPLTQRSKLKTELHKTSEDIIRIISTVMGADDASPSTRQAAVECVEQWVKLPGIGLHQWASVLSVVFGAVSEDSICSCQGSYAVDELISDLPSSFFMTLREHIGSAASGNKKDEMCNVIAYWFHFKVVTLYNNTLFDRYRMVRSEVSIDAYFITGRDALKFLNMELEETITKGDLCRTECIMFLWETVADYLSESDYLEIYDNLKLCMQLSNIGEGADEDRLANTVMRHLYALSHLIQEHDDVISKEALRTLEKFVSDDDISQICYTFFMNESNAQELRLMALKCIGYVLSMKPSHDCMQSAETLENKKFQISIFACLFASLNHKGGVRNAVTNFPSEHLPQMFPLVSLLLNKALFTNPAAGSSLAKTVVLVSLQLFIAIEEWLSLIYQSLLRSALVQPSVLVIFYWQGSHNVVLKHVFCHTERWMQILRISFKAIFVRIQVELIRATVESLSEVLFFFMKEFSTETRCVLNGLDHGDSPLVAAMFREIGNLRNFKQMTLRLNMASRKSACS